MKARGSIKLLSLALASTLVIACGDDPPRADRGTGSGRGAPARNNATNTTRNAADAGVEEAGASGPPAHGRVLADVDFTESDRSRDPFRSFAQNWIPRQSNENSLPLENIKLANFALDDLRVIAIVVGVANPYAMLTDTSGAGTIIRRGDHVGRPDTIVSPGENGGPHQVPWRVARIVGSRLSRDRSNNLVEIPAEVVFEREDRASLTPTRIERSLTLAPPGEGRGGPVAADTAGASALPSLPSLPGGSPFLPPNPASLPPGSRTTSTTSTQGNTTVQSFTTIVPPTQGSQQQSQPQQTTVVVQAPQSQPQQSQPQPVPLPNTPPPVRITGSDPFPSAGLPR
ncbi:MAG: hypothetical protein U0269_37990 [Polyangiales bacterium]